jgi:glycosyltransferase involved in cell wall biosynthesis
MRVKVVYAGNIGEGQGLHLILPRLASRLADRVEFTVIGDGGRRSQLKQSLATAHVRNVTLLPPVSRLALIEEYRKADVLFLHLNDYDAFRKVLPSKIFEYAALGKPIWAGIAGYSAGFVVEEVRNASVFTPCDVDGAVESFDRLELRDMPRPEFITKFRRSNIMNQMAADLLRVARGISALGSARNI